MVVDFLSRRENNVEGTPTEDSFPDGHLFAISTNTLWYVNIANYLAIGKVPRHLSYRDQWKIFIIVPDIHGWQGTSFIQGSINRFDVVY